jgi:hypothetical protein
MSRKTRQRRAQAAQEPNEDFEVLDATEEVEEAPAYATIPETTTGSPADAKHADPVAKEDDDPYAVLQRNFDAVKKAKEEAEERAREESLRRQAVERQRDELDGRVAKSATSELENHKALVQKEYTLAENEASAAETAYAQAMEAGDYAAAAKAQRALVRIEGKLKQLEDIYIAVEDKIKNPPRPEPKQAQQVDEFEEGIKQLPKPLQDWAREHEDDLRKRADVALAAGNLAVRKGLQPGSDAYLDFMDEQMGYFVDDEPEPEPEPAPRPAPKRRIPPSAPVSRTSPSDPSKVYLTDFDKKTARELKMTDREYAVFKRDAPNSQHAKKFEMQANSRSGGR